VTAPLPNLLDAPWLCTTPGCCVLPAADDGSKRPAVDWKRWQAERPDRSTTSAPWFGPGAAGAWASWPAPSRAASS
jgi:hypothetical protein